jgi:multiple sugar transport system permease protein
MTENSVSPAVASPDQQVRRRKWAMNNQLRENISGYLFAAPWLLSLILLTAYPIGASIYYSFTQYTVLKPAIWVGLANFQEILKDELFWKALYNTTYYAVFSVPLGLLTAFWLGILLNQKIPGRAFFRATFFLPSIVPVVAASIVWAIILQPQFGLINDLLGRVGLYKPPWLTSPLWSKPAFILMSLWGVGPTTIIFLAGIQDIPQHLYEAAEIDGANALDRLFAVTLPMLSPTIFFNLVTGIIGAFQVFAQIYIISDGGPLWSTLMYVYYLWRQGFQYFKMGYASALALILFVIILALTMVVILTSRRWVYYEGER